MLTVVYFPSLGRFRCVWLCLDRDRSILDWKSGVQGLGHPKIWFHGFHLWLSHTSKDQLLKESGVMAIEHSAMTSDEFGSGACAKVLTFGGNVANFSVSQCFSWSWIYNSSRDDSDAGDDGVSVRVNLRIFIPLCLFIPIKTVPSKNFVSVSNITCLLLSPVGSDAIWVTQTLLVEIQDFDGSERLAAVLGADIAGEPEFKKRLIPNIAITPKKINRPCLGSEFSVQILPKALC